MPNSDDFLVVAKILVAKDQNSCSVSVLFCNCKNCNLHKFPISRGISLWKLLFWRVRFFKKLKFPTCGDIKPTSFEDCRSNTMTLWCRRPQVAPLHLQKWMLWFQELITPRGSWMILALNLSNIRSICYLVFWIGN